MRRASLISQPFVSLFKQLWYRLDYAAEVPAED